MRVYHPFLLLFFFCVQITTEDLFAQTRDSLPNATYVQGGITRGDSTCKSIALVFTADEFGDGAAYITKALKSRKVRASFFFTGNFYRNPDFQPVITRLKKDGHYLGSHSDKHLLYCSWENRDSLLVTKEEFKTDLLNSYAEMEKFGIQKKDALFYLPPYEWYNDSISKWTKEEGLQLVNFTPGTRSNADYTYPEMGNRYVNNETIMRSILDFEKNKSAGLNGFILLIHFGTDPRRTEKLYHELPGLLRELKNRGYQFVKINELLASD